MAEVYGPQIATRLLINSWGKLAVIVILDKIIVIRLIE